jgi:hypothetical protein
MFPFSHRYEAVKRPSEHSEESHCGEICTWIAGPCRRKHAVTHGGENA